MSLDAAPPTPPPPTCDFKSKSKSRVLENQNLKSKSFSQNQAKSKSKSNHKSRSDFQITKSNHFENNRVERTQCIVAVRVTRNKCKNNNFYAKHNTSIAIKVTVQKRFPRKCLPFSFWQPRALLSIGDHLFAGIVQITIGNPRSDQSNKLVTIRDLRSDPFKFPITMTICDSICAKTSWRSAIRDYMRAKCLWRYAIRFTQNLAAIRRIWQSVQYNPAYPAWLTVFDSIAQTAFGLLVLVSRVIWNHDFDFV